MTSALAIHDTMKHVTCDVATVCIGSAYSAGSFLLASGKKEKRYVLPNARIMIHQPSGGAQGQVTDIQIHAQEALILKEIMNKLYAEYTGHTKEEIFDAMERDRFMSPSQALKFGLVDHVMKPGERLG